MTRPSFRNKRESIGGVLPIVAAGLLSVLNAPQLFAAEPSHPDAKIEQRIQGLVPKLEAYVASGMKDFDVPGVAIGIVAGDKLVYSKGLGFCRKGAQPVDA